MKERDHAEDGISAFSFGTSNKDKDVRITRYPFSKIRQPEDALSQMSELTWSAAENFDRTGEGHFVEEENDIIMRILMEKRNQHSAEMSSTLSIGTYERLLRKVREFHSRHNAYERALKLADAMNMDEESDSSFDDSNFPPILFAVNSILSFLCFQPLMTDDMSIAQYFRNSETSWAVVSPDFFIAAGFTLGCCAPLAIDLFIQTSFRAINKLKSAPLPESALNTHLMGQTRLAFCLSVIKPNIILFAIYWSGHYDQLAPYFICQLFWQPVIFTSIGISFIAKYTPNVVPKIYLVFMYLCLLVGSVIKIYASIGYYNPMISVFQAILWVTTGAMYLWYLYKESKRIIARFNGAPWTFALLSPVTISTIYIHSVFLIMMAMEWFVTLISKPANVWTSLEVSRTEIICHVMNKCLIIILFILLPVNLASAKMKRTKGALQELLSLSADDTSQSPGASDEVEG